MTVPAEWPNTAPGAVMDWIEFRMGPFPDRLEADGTPDVTRRVYRVNTSFMLSNWKCIFGEGCPGVLISGAMSDRGCCQIGVHIERKEVSRLSRYVKQLTEEDLDKDLLDEVKARGWKYKVEDQGDRDAGHTYHTRVVDGACVLANRAGGSSGKIGCALHVLANRLGISPTDTKPDICWQLPVTATEWYDADENLYFIEVSNTNGETWGDRRTDLLSHPGWFCTETPDAYCADDLVYRTNEESLRKQMGDDAYDQMTELLDDMVSSTSVQRMNGQLANGGRPLIPLMVKARIEAWAEDIADSESETSADSMAAWDRSKEFIQ